MAPNVEEGSPIVYETGETVTGVVTFVITQGFTLIE
jgi:hypothetical protein